MANPSVTVTGAGSEWDNAQPLPVPSIDEMQYATQVANAPAFESTPTSTEPSISDVLSQMYNSPANKMPTYDQVMNVIKGFGSAGESLGRGVVAGIPGVVGDLNQLGQEYVQPYLPQPVQNALQALPAAPTTQSYLNQIPRYTQPFGDATANNFMEGLGTALSPDALTAAAPVGRFLGNAAGERIMAGQSLIPGVPADLVNPQILSAVKNKGGNWLANGLDSLDWLKKPIESVGESRFDSAWDNGNPEKVAKHISEMEKIGYSPEQIKDFKDSVAVNNWVDKKLKNYVRNEMGTPQDPLLALADQGITHLPNRGEVDPNYFPALENTRVQRAAAGMPQEGFANTPLGRRWEILADEAIRNKTAGMYVKQGESPSAYGMSIRHLEQNPWLKTVDPKTPVHATSGFINDTGIGHIVDELKNSIDPRSGLPEHLRLKPETLDKMTVPHAVKHVAKVNKWRAEQAANAAKDTLKDFPIVHEGGNGYNIHELKLPITPLEGKIVHNPNESYPYEFIDPNGKVLRREKTQAELEKNLQKDAEQAGWHKLDKALKNEGEQMGHCVGGYTDSVASGKSRIFSLRDEKGGAHATIEVHPHIDTDYNPNKIPEDIRTKFRQESEKEAADLKYPPGTHAWHNYVVGGEIQKGEKWIKQNPKVTLNVNQIKGKGNGAVSEKYRGYIKDWLNKEADKVGSINDLENVGLFRGSDVLHDSLHRGGEFRKIVREAAPDSELPKEEFIKQFGKKFYSTPEELAKDVIKYLDSKKPQTQEHKMLQGFYRGYAGEPTAEGTTFVSPQKAVADYYAQKRAGQTGLTPHAEMVLADPFAGVKYGHATAGTGAQPNIITQARKLAPEQIANRTQLYAEGGKVEAEKLTPAQMRDELFAKSREYQAQVKAGEPRTLQQRMIDQGLLKPTGGVSGGAGFTPGTMNPFNPDSPLNRKNGGKIPSIDEMRLTLIRNK